MSTERLSPEVRRIADRLLDLCADAVENGYAREDVEDGIGVALGWLNALSSPRVLQAAGVARRNAMDHIKEREERARSVKLERDDGSRS